MDELSDSILPIVSVVLVNYNSSAYTLACVKSIEATAKGLAFEIIVVDNASCLEEYQKLSALPAGIVQIRSEINTGFSGGNMLGVNKARGRYVFLLNNDTLLEPDCLQKLVTVMEALPQLAICAPQMLDEHRRTTRWKGHFPTPGQAWFGLKRWYKPLHIPLLKVQAVDYVSGSALFIRRDTLNELGGMDLGYFLYLEEEDLCWRARKAGHEVALVKDADYVHFGNGSEAINEPMLREYYISLIRFLYKNLSLWQAILCHAFYVFKEVRRTRRGRVHARLAWFILQGAPEKYSLRHRQSNGK